MESEKGTRKCGPRGPGSRDFAPAVAGTILFGILILALSAGSYPVSAPHFSSAASPHDSGAFRNLVSVELIRADGFREPTQYAWNTVTEEGLNWTRDVISGLYLTGTNVNRTNYGNWSFIELSISGTTPAVTDSVCPSVVTGNGLGIAQATTIVRQNRGNYTVSVTFSPTGTQTGITKVCLSNNSASASTDLMASALLAVNTSVVSGDTLIVNYSVAVT
jgi:hypothetical protein